MVLLVDHDVEGVVTRAAKAHIDNLPVTTEASALLHTLGMDPVTNSTLKPTSTGLLPPPPPPVDSVVMPTVGAVVTIDAVTNVSTMVRSRGCT